MSQSPRDLRRLQKAARRFLARSFPRAPGIAIAFSPAPGLPAIVVGLDGEYPAGLCESDWYSHGQLPTFTTADAMMAGG